MAITLRLVLMILALICLFFAAAGVQARGSVNLFALGMAMFVLAMIVTV